MPRTVHAQRVVLTGFGAFNTPAFKPLSQPAPLYLELLRQLGPFGFTVSSLSADFSDMQSAYVQCQLKDITVKVKLLGIEVVVYDPNTSISIEEVFEATLKAVKGSDESLKVDRIEITVGTWFAVEGGYGELAKALVPSISTGGHVIATPTRATWSVSIGKGRGTVSIDQSANNEDELFYRLSLSYDGSDQAAIAKAFADDYLQVFAALGLETVQKS